MMSRKLTKKILSVAGATILLGTFIAKDARKDKLKELVDSIDNAESVFIIRNQNRSTQTGIKKFEEFVEESFKKLDPNRANKPQDLTMLEKSPLTGRISPLLIAIDISENSSEVLDNISRLADKLPQGSIPDQATLPRIKREADDLEAQVKHLESEEDRFIGVSTTSFERAKDEEDHLNNQARLLSGKAFEIEDQVYDLDQTVLKKSEVVRLEEKHRYEEWEKTYYALYGLGWVISMAGILIGGEEEKSVIEELEEG
jgi:hypothetical protein